MISLGRRIFVLLLSSPYSSMLRLLRPPQACLLAADWRTRYQMDCVVDIVGYRRCGTHPLTQSLLDRHLRKQVGVIRPQFRGSKRAKLGNQPRVEFTHAVC